MVHQNKFSESRTHTAIAFLIPYSTPAVAADISEQTGISKKMGGGGWTQKSTHTKRHMRPK